MNKIALLLAVVAALLGMRSDIEANDIELENYIGTVMDFPSPGIAFRDIGPLLSSPEAFRYTIAFPVLSKPSRFSSSL